MSIYKDNKVLLAKFTSSDQMVADNTGKATSKVEDYWRVKTYVKPEDMVDPHYPRFPEPYALGQRLLGGTWNDYNKPFIVQVAQCNIDCWYCFVDKKLREGKAEDNGQEIGGWFTAEEVVEMWKASGSKVLRISGGEPTLASKFLMDMVTLMQNEDGLLWIDTNLSTNNTLFNAFRMWCADISHSWGDEIGHLKPWGWNVGICGCFKGFTNEQAAATTGSDLDLLDRQIEMARRIVTELPFQPFFYVPGLVEKSKCYDVAVAGITSLFNRLREEVHDYAPLRTYTLEMKNYSSTVVEQWNNYDGMLPVGPTINDYYIRPINIWEKLKKQTYSPELLWLPSNQISLRGEK